MLKRLSLVTMFLFLLGAVVVANDLGQRDVVRLGNATQVANNEYVVPLYVSHDEDLTAMDIPLEYSKGVTLTNVAFNEDRVGYFDVKIGSIIPEKNQVLIGLIAMVYESKAPLASGDAEIAKLTFRVDDLTMTEFKVSPFSSNDPGHDLSLVYNSWQEGKPAVQEVSPDFQGGTVALKPGGSKPVPTVYDLAQNVPNPFNPTTAIAYALPKSGMVNLSIYNILGQRVTTLVDGFQDAGSYSMVWNGTDQNGSQVASGVYFYRINAGDYNSTKKMVLMK